jgi:biuret amidohydrolase
VAVELASLIAPSRAALVINECQRGVIGDQSLLPELAKAAAPAVSHIARLAATARRSGVPVVLCTAVRRSDGRGSNQNARLFMATRRSPRPMVSGSAPAEIVPELAVAETDIVLPRMHGVSPMSGTGLDPVLRNLGVRTIVAAGVSVNVAITNLVFDAVNLGYQVVIPRDAVAGLPPTYVDAVFEHTLGLLATVTTADEVARAWEAGS